MLFRSVSMTRLMKGLDERDQDLALFDLAPGLPSPRSRAGSSRLDCRDRDGPNGSLGLMLRIGRQASRTLPAADSRLPAHRQRGQRPGQPTRVLCRRERRPRGLGSGGLVPHGGHHPDEGVTGCSIPILEWHRAVRRSVWTRPRRRSPRPDSRPAPGSPADSAPATLSTRCASKSNTEPGPRGTMCRRSSGRPPTKRWPSKASEWSPVYPPTEIISGYRAQQFFANVHVDFANDSRWTPSVGAGVGMARTHLLYSRRLVRKTLAQGYQDVEPPLTVADRPAAAAGTLSLLEPTATGALPWLSAPGRRGLRRRRAHLNRYQRPLGPVRRVDAGCRMVACSQP